MRLSPCTVALSCLSRNARKCRMVMDRFEVLGFYHVTRDTAVTIERQRNVAHQILDELGIVIGTLGYVFSSARLSNPYTSQEALRSAISINSSIAISPASSASIRICERWLCAP